MNQLYLTFEGSECIRVDEFGDYPVPANAVTPHPLRFTLIDGEVKERYTDIADDQEMIEHHASLQEAERSKLISEQLAEEAAKAKVLTKLAFMELLTDTELAGIYTAAKQDVRVEIFMDKLKLAETVDLLSPQMQESLRALSEIGLLTPERVEEILG